MESIPTNGEPVVRPMDPRDPHPRAEVAENPAPGSSFGSIERFTEVSSEGERFPLCELVVPFEEEDLGWVDASTLRVFRVDADGGFALVPGSRAVPAERQVRAWIDAPGVYGTFGLPKHPAVMEAVRAFRSARGRLRGDRKLGAKICQLILCEPPGDRWQGAGVPKVPGRVGGNVCDFCLGGGLTGELPEFELFDPPGGGLPEPGRDPDPEKCPPPQPCPDPGVGNGKIAWADALPWGEYSIWVMEADGSGQTQLTPSDGRNDFDPAWSPDSTKIAFSSNEDLVVMNADGSGRTTLTDGRHPTWSPDGTKLAFYAFTGPAPQQLDIFVIDANGSNRMPLTSDPTLDQDPVWSPDGTRIAFSRYLAQFTNDVEIHVMNADGSNLTQLTVAGPARFPTWSPDGARIAFQTWAGGIFRISAVEVSSGTVTQLTPATTASVSPAWAPDGTKIAYGLDGIWVMNADGTSPVQLGPIGHWSWSPDWQPVPAIS